MRGVAGLITALVEVLASGGRGTAATASSGASSKATSSCHRKCTAERRRNPMMHTKHDANHVTLKQETQNADFSGIAVQRHRHPVRMNHGENCSDCVPQRHRAAAWSDYENRCGIALYGTCEARMTCNHTAGTAVRQRPTSRLCEQCFASAGTAPRSRGRRNQAPSKRETSVPKCCPVGSWLCCSPWPHWSCAAM